MPYIDFAEVKQRISIERAMDLLGLSMTGKGAQYRSACPACKSGGDRALVVTPAKGLFYCFASGIGGDVIAFASHIRSCKPPEAAHFLMGTSTSEPVTGNSTSSQETAPQNQKAPVSRCPVLDYLDHEHAAVEAIGLDGATALAIGAGYAPKGIMRGTVAIPIRLPDGSLCGYIGLTEIAKLPSKFFLETNVVAFPKKTA